jgi:hypothetical protein
MSNDFVATEIRRPLQLPAQAKIIQIGLGVEAGGRIQLAMTGYTDLTECPTENDFAAQVAEYVSDPCGRPPLMPFGERKPDADTCFKANDMSLRLSKPRYLVYHLDDALSWRFSRNFAPFTQDAALAKDQIFSDARLITNEGKLLAAGEFCADCRFAVLIFTPPADLPPDFVYRFNLHIELLDDPNDPINGAYIPIILDPDVRWPGGTASGPGGGG